MTRGWVSLFLLSLTAACQMGSTHVTVRVEPESVELAPLTTQQFTVKVSGTSDRRVTWSVVGLGSVSADGLYTAPGVIPPDSQNIIRVVATSVTGETAEATLRMIPAPLEPTRGPTEGGTIVRITGEGFVTGTEVFFGGVPVDAADLSVESPVLLRVRTPPHVGLGAVDLVIQVPGRDAVVYPKAFHYGATRIQMEGATLVSTCNSDYGDHVVADFDGDGETDMAVVCYDGGIEIHTGDGAGNFAYAFGAPFDIMTDYPYGIEAGDLDGDGDLDPIVVGNNGAHLYTNSETSLAFDETISWNGPTFGYYIGLAVADFTGDGKADLAYPDYTADRIVIRLNDGAGGFPTTTYIATENSPYHVVAAKIDGDNDYDLVATFTNSLTPVSPLGGIVVLTNGGNGNFSVTQEVLMHENAYSVGMGDFDADGDQDAVVVFASLPPSWIRNNGGGTFAVMTDLTHVAGHYHQYSKPGVGDLDDDGVVDAFVHYTHLNRIQVYYGEALAGLDTAYTEYDTTDTPYNIHAADVTGDGKADLITRGYEVAEVYKGQGTRQFGPPKVLLGAMPAHVGLLPKSGGNAVALVAHPNGGAGLGSVSLVDVSTMLSPTPSVTKIDLPPTSSVDRVHASDVTGDGLQDVLAVDRGTHNGGMGSVWLLEGAEGNTFEAAVRVVATNAAMEEVADTAFSDLDGDGRVDLVVARHDGTFVESSVGAVEVLWGSPTGFETALTGWVGVTPTRLAIADLDDDGLQEILVTDTVQKKLFVLTVSGRSVVETADLDVGDDASDILVADFDRDYVKDIAVQSRYTIAYSIEIDVFKGLGYLTWDVPERYRFYGYGYGLVYGDIDGDELEDLAIPVSYPTSVAVLRGHDNGRFLDPELALVPGAPIGVSLADIDGDALIDLIVADQNTSSLRPLANRSK